MDSCGAEGDHFLERILNFLERIVTEDETWINHYERDSKRQGMEWKHPQSSAKRKFKMHLTAGKVTLTGFWDSQGLMLEHYQERVQQCTVPATVGH